jgi:DNA-binding transcriptional LysR family regulator
LTPEGEQFVKLAKSYLESHEGFLQEVQELSSRPLPDSTINIYATPFVLVSEIFDDILNDLANDHHNIRFTVHESQPTDVAKKIFEDKEAGISSIGIINLPDFIIKEMDLPSALRYEFLLETQLVARVGEQSPHSHKKIFLKRELSALPLVCFNEPLMERCIRQLLEGFDEPSFVISSSNAKLGRGININQNHISFSLDILSKKAQHKHGVYIPIHDSLIIKIGLAVSEELYLAKPEVRLAYEYFRHHIIDTYPDYAIK